MLLADKGYDANALRQVVADKKAWANISPKANRKDPICFSKHLYKARNLIERFFNKIKQFRRIATRYDKLAENYAAALKLVAVRIWIRDLSVVALSRGNGTHGRSRKHMCQGRYKNALSLEQPYRYMAPVLRTGLKSEIVIVLTKNAPHQVCPLRLLYPCFRSVRHNVYASLSAGVPMSHQK